ncbi:MAG: hypothetical protein HS104_12705 [Polyangiaceae bacterium]|nr:hypothetical protein [Polyangiaceae bacterium]MCL4752017.1 hypothetical protein [Myxococcales bacterium]
MSETGAASPPLWRRFGPRALLLLGLGAAAALLLPSLPQEQVLVFRVGAPVRRLTVSYTREGEVEPRSGATLSYTSAPTESVRHSVSLPNGRYVVSLDVERATADGGVRETSYVRRVNLDGHETVLPLEDTP